MQELRKPTQGHKQIPTGWDVLKFEDIINSTQLGVDITGSSDSDKRILLIKMGNLTFGSFDFTKLEYVNKEKLENFKLFLLKEGDFLFNTRNSDILVGKCAVWKKEFPEAIFNNNIMRIYFKPDKVYSSDFVSYTLNSSMGRSQLQKLVDRTTSVAAIYYKNLKAYRILLPSVAEQHKITSILSGVDELIQKTDQVIEQTQRLKAVLVNFFFTQRGPYKEYFINEIGKDFGDAPFGTQLKSKDCTDKGIPIIRGINIKDNKFYWTHPLYVSNEKFGSLTRSHCRQGDLVFQKIGNSIGDVAIMPSIEGHNKFLLSTNMMKMSVKADIADLTYVYYYFGQQHIRNYIKNRAGGSAKPIFNFTTLKNFKIVLPDISRQKEAVLNISKIEMMIESENARKIHLEALKRGLMQKLLTGRIRVKA